MERLLVAPAPLLLLCRNRSPLIPHLRLRALKHLNLENITALESPISILGHRNSAQPYAWISWFPHLRRKMGRCVCPAGVAVPARTQAERETVLYAARIGHCRPCPLREQYKSGSTKKPRRVSAVFWPRTSPPPGGAALASKADQHPAETAPAPPLPLFQLSRCAVAIGHAVGTSDGPWSTPEPCVVSVRATETLVPRKFHSPPLETHAERARLRTLLGATAHPQCCTFHRPHREIVLHGLSHR